MRRPDPRYAERAGFDAAFLGAPVPVPVVGASRAGDVASGPGVADGVLRYHHFSLVLSATRRFAFFVAANVDGRRRFTQARDDDRWVIDPRLPGAQVGDELYHDNDLDRGHLARRADLLWGDSLDDALTAVADTFHYANCVPQHRDFNQNQTTWQGLEDYVLTRIADGRLRANVYTGPVFGDDDPTYRGVRIPRAFWKVVAAGTAGGRVHATAYLLEQSALITDLQREREEPPLGPYLTFQTAVSHVEALTGVDFGPLRAVDPFTPPPGAERGERPLVELKSVEGITL